MSIKVEMKVKALEARLEKLEAKVAKLKTMVVPSKAGSEKVEEVPAKRTRRSRAEMSQNKKIEGSDE